MHSSRIAVIGYSRLSLAAEIINQILDIPIGIYTLEGPLVDIPRIADKALQNGNDTIIGGSRARRYADRIYVNNYLVISNRETLYQVITEAVNTVTVRGRSRWKLRYRLQ